MVDLFSIGFSKSKNFANFDFFSREIEQAYNQDLKQKIGIKPKIKGQINVGDPTRLIMSPDGGGGTGGGVSIQENKDYRFVVKLPNGYKVGVGKDKNVYRLNSGKPKVIITGNITGKWLKFNPTLLQLGYYPTNTSGVVRITSPTNLAGYEIPLKFLNVVI
jgi:hypothetical protein